MKRLAFAAVFAASACAGDETVTGYAPTGTTWHLVELDGADFTARATLVFGENGAFSGDAPCNRYGGASTVPYPWFQAAQVFSTKRACADLDAETAFFAALSDMTLAEASKSTLILSNEAGREMLFRAQPG